MNLNYFCYVLLAFTAAGSALLPYPLAMWFVLVSALTLVIYGADKLAARKAGRRGLGRSASGGPPPPAPTATSSPTRRYL